MTPGQNKKRVAALLLAIVYIVVAGIGLYYDQQTGIHHEYIWGLLLPAALMLLLLCAKRIEETFLFIAFCTPFAVNVSVFQGMELSLPTEPLLIIVSAIVLFRILLVQEYDKALLRHPVTVLLLLSLTWMFITALLSHNTTTSLKYLAARLWFVIPCFFAATFFFQNPRRIKQFYTAYAIALGVIVIISTIKTLGNIHDLQVLHRVMRPFYNDHTAYGCVTALFLPGAIYYLFEHDTKKWQRILYLFIAIILLVGVSFSYARAAWLSLIGALCVWILVRWRIKAQWIIAALAVAIIVVLPFKDDILYKMEKNKQDSSLTLSGQVQSISNISTDASNLERLNRWACAFRMFNDYPIYGFGPGTYQFFYGSYQRSDQLSTISTNAGDLGNAHSEYLGPLSEQGLPGMLIVVALFIYTFSTGVRVYRTAEDRKQGRLALALTLCLTTYYIHGFFNNFLDTDKLSVPFWAFTAAIVSLDRFAAKKGKDTLPVSNE